jgi:hypothetical protein
VARRHFPHTKCCSLSRVSSAEVLHCWIKFNLCKLSRSMSALMLDADCISSDLVHCSSLKSTSKIKIITKCESLQLVDMTHKGLFINLDSLLSVIILNV